MSDEVKAEVTAEEVKEVKETLTPEEMRLELSRARRDAKKYRESLREVEDRYSQLEGESTKFKTLAEQLQAGLRERDHKQTFNEVASALKIRPEAVQDAWKLSSYQADTDTPDAEKVKELLTGLVQAKPWLLAPEAEAPVAPLVPGPGAQRGSPLGTTDRNFVVSRSKDLPDPYWQRDNQKAFRLALQEGRVKYTE